MPRNPERPPEPEGEKLEAEKETPEQERERRLDALDDWKKNTEGELDFHFGTMHAEGNPRLKQLMDKYYAKKQEILESFGAKSGKDGRERVSEITEELEEI